ncbi:MAG: aminotransferase class I/II-fold pyridoxal phosphate-dependent enzyme, partial [Deltaproteobacteria bacterium]|nr:aminotransferase class I/II-fold pyridoxal phosphate-dependent enzyme [Deltaproteobacteria bacterium]
MRTAQRINFLGTETAFAVAERAAAYAAAGRKVYPFHLGDLNFSTPAHIVEAARKAIGEGKTGYCPNGGILPLREALAADANTLRGTAYTAENVSVQPGGKPVIGKFIQIFMNPGDEVLYPSPGYPIYESQIEYYNGKAVPYGFIAGKDGFLLDWEGMERAITPKTRILILNDFQNPTGASCSDGELEQLADLACRHDLAVLLDEAYFEMNYEGKSRSLAGFPGLAERSVILYSFGKKFAMTGWRLGAAIGPREVIRLFTQLNTNAESCTTHFVQYAGLAALQGDQGEAARILRTLRERRDAAVTLLNACPGIRCFSPRASFYLYPEVSGLMEKKGFGRDYAAFA